VCKITLTYFIDEKGGLEKAFEEKFNNLVFKCVSRMVSLWLSKCRHTKYIFATITIWKK